MSMDIYIHERKNPCPPYIGMFTAKIKSNRKINKQINKNKQTNK